MMFCKWVMLTSGWTPSGAWDPGPWCPPSPWRISWWSYASRGLQVISLGGGSVFIEVESQLWGSGIDESSSSRLGVPFPVLTLPFCEYESLMETSGCSQWTPRPPGLSFPALRMPWIHAAKPGTRTLLGKLTRAFIPGPPTPQDQDSHCLSVSICFPVTTAFYLFQDWALGKQVHVLAVCLYIIFNIEYGNICLQ